MNNTLILGVGNILLNDEGIGIQVIRHLTESGGFPGVDVMDGGTGGLHLLGFLNDYKNIVMIDASLDDFPAGHVRLIHPRFSKDFPKQLSAHEIGLKDMVDALGILGTPPKIYLIAISVKDFQEMGMTLSKEVEDAIPKVIGMVRELINKL